MKQELERRRRFAGRRALASLVGFFLINTFLAPELLAAALTSPMVFNNSESAPLTGTLVVNTDVPTRVSVSVDDGVNSWQRPFFDYGLSHSLPMAGFRADRTNRLTVTLWEKSQEFTTLPDVVTFVTAPLPVGFPTIKVLTKNAELMEPGYTLFRLVVNNYHIGFLTIIDNDGEVVWYSTLNSSHDFRQLSNGNLMMGKPTSFDEVSIVGDTLRSYPTAAGFDADAHENLPTTRGTILYFSEQSTNIVDFPSSATDATAPPETAAVGYNWIVEVSTNTGAVMGKWNLLDMLDPRRISYLTFVQDAFGWDNHHGNAIFEDPKDGGIIASLRTQNAIIKFTRDGQLKWILGTHDNWGAAFQRYLLTPVGEPFEWQWAQHAMKVTPQGTLLVYDDGNYRASPFDISVPDAQNYSRAVEYAIDEQTMEVRQVWEYGKNSPEVLFTSFAGDVEWLPKTDHVLVDFSAVSYINGEPPLPDSPNATETRIQEVTHEANPEVIWDISILDPESTFTNYTGNWVYRARRIADLYGHPAMPVTDLTVSLRGSAAYLNFSADPQLTYAIEASNDLIAWTDIGSAELDSKGLGVFADSSPEAAAAGGRFYRIVTH
jgi:hypothetical protein